uniref:Terpene synthase 14 n=1 Tax=Taiwania cryptomerioides TaxID=50187 RepID=A0A6C0QEC7_TAICR|nr:terpene synthase 14 [Taiwania cryptomerioides]WBO26429.1 geraniol synthase [Taiwania cryptomerioides]
MALISSFPSDLSLCFKSQPTLSHTAQFCSKTLPLMHRKNFNAIINQPSAKVEIPFLGTGKNDPKLWEDDFLQPIPKHPYEHPSYAERCGRLISEIKNMFTATAAAGSLDNNVFQLLAMVDNIERLGIGRHFRKEIKEALDFVYRHWGERQRDLNITALGFRILRLHRYPVSSGMFGHFQRANGQFLCFTVQAEEEKVKGILNLFRASLIAFPGEKILDEAKDFCATYLSQTLQKTDISSHLLREISFNLEYGSYANLPRLEARKYIEIYEENSSWARMGGHDKILSLAQMDFKMIQSMHQQELQTYSRWWRDSGLSQLKFARRRHIEYFFLACAICEDEKYSAFRSSIAKLSAIATYIADTYHIYGTLDELKCFTNAIKKWDVASTEQLPKYMKVIYTALYETINEIDQNVQKIQGQDTVSISKNIWKSYIDAMMQEVEWHASGNISTLAEHLENGKFESGTHAIILQSLLLVDGILLENIIQKLDYPSRLDDLLCLCLKLIGDVKSFKGEVDRGEAISSTSCYMRDNPRTTKKDALDYVRNLLDERIKELNWEFLKSNKVPTCSKDFTYDITRGFLHFHQDRDSFSISSKDIQNHVTQIIIDTIKM